MIERAVLDGERAALRGGERVAGKAIDRAVDARKSAGAAPCSQTFGVARADAARAAGEQRRASSAATMMCFGSTTLMQWASDAPVRLVLSSATTPPTRVMPSQIAMIFRPVRHQQADGVALGEALRQRPARVAVGARGELAVAEASRGRRAAPARRRIVSASSSITCGKDARRIVRDRRRHPQRAQRAAQTGRRRPRSRSNEVPWRLPAGADRRDYHALR